MRIIFTISGNKIQEVGYRLFLLHAMKERGIVGYPTNLYDGKHISVSAWHKNRKRLEDFYSFLKLNTPNFVGEIDIAKKIIDNESLPSTYSLLNEKMDLMVEQTGKFVEEGVLIRKGINKLPKELGKSFRTLKICKYKRK